MRLSPRWRKALLTLHVTTAVGWLGADVVLLTLGVAGARGVDPGVVYPAVGLVGQVLFVPLSVLAWLVGVASALLTPWGLVRHRWVVVKLVITTVMLGAVLFALRPNLRAAAELGAAVPADVREGLLAAPIVSSTLLIVATVLSTYKPWGRTRRRTGVPGDGTVDGGKRARGGRAVPPVGGGEAVPGRPLRSGGRRADARRGPDARPGPAGRRTGTGAWAR
ncbi:hypothetical protein [Plantactinospora sonchi]|uniref:DUF2269 domain-containing protein n=1 Tax=Plantactinospora sonchi TaxID=1544735 RepID=A0ABU7S0I0_9ACTN